MGSDFGLVVLHVELRNPNATTDRQQPTLTSNNSEKYEEEEIRIETTYRNATSMALSKNKHTRRAVQNSGPDGTVSRIVDPGFTRVEQPCTLSYT